MRSKICHFTSVLLCCAGASFVPVAGKAASVLEFGVSSQWVYRQQRFSDKILAHGQADLVDSSGTLSGGVGFYCGIPGPYIDIFVHKPGGTLAQYLWGEATFKTSLKFNGTAMPASVEQGIIYVNIRGDDDRAMFARAFELGPAVNEQRSTVDVANLAKFDLVVRPTQPKNVPAGALVVPYSRMTALCDATPL
jgi:hypothetical protein